MSNKTVVMSGRIKEILAGMIQATKAEADIRDNVAATLEKAGQTAWAKCRDALFSVLNGKPDKAEDGSTIPVTVTAHLLLDAFRDFCKEAATGQETMKRGVQYASDLRRAVKLIEKGGKLPADLKKATRSAWNDAEVWREAGILAPSGKAKGSDKAKSGGKVKGKTPAADDGTEKPAGVAEAADKPLSEVMALVARLTGPFRAEWMETAKAEAERILRKQVASTGNGKAEAAAA